MNNIIDIIRDGKMPWWYRNFFAQCNWLKSQYRRIEYVKNSKSSLCFGNPNSQEASFGFLKDAFKFLGDNKHIETMFKRGATSGDGHEWSRITRLHSSSLLPFLVFCNVSDKKSLQIDIDGKEEKFYNVHFEVKNWIQPNDNHPSNIDVVLENENVILFLESKFTEYFNRTSRVNFPRRYSERFKKIEQELQPEITMEKDVLTAKNYLYLEGVKQMVAHYMGLEFAATKGNYNHGGDQQFLINGRNVYFGEILFDFTAFLQGCKRAKCLEDYKKLYKKVTSALLKTSDMASPPKILPAILTYQELVKGYALDDSVAQFYQFKK